MFSFKRLGLIWLVMAMLLPVIAQTNAVERNASNEGAEIDVEKSNSKRPNLEVVFVLDTTGSMSGMIKNAKEKIWAIANSLATAKPTPNIRMGLVGFRDLGDNYVTKHVTLTDDLDEIYSKLMEFNADGGGDTPESVNQALNEAVVEIPWSKEDGTFRVVYLVGDSPPHMDYDDVKYKKSCSIAAEKMIVINTIQCGNNRETTKIWKEIAELGEGQFFQVAQDGGGAQVAETPYDKDLAELSRKLDGTRIYYGVGLEEQNAKRRVSSIIYSNADSRAIAQRASFNASKAGKTNFIGHHELVEDVSSGNVKISDLDKNQLPKELQSLDEQDLEKLISEKIMQRGKIQKQIIEISQKRQKHIKEELEKSGKSKDSLDYKMWNGLREQAKEKNEIIMDGEVKY